MDKLLTVKDLALRWQVTERTIREWIKDNKIKVCKDVPTPRFSESYILKLEGVELDKYSPLEFKRQQKELESLKEENKQLKEILREYQVIGSKSLSYLVK